MKKVFSMIIVWLAVLLLLSCATDRRFVYLADGKKFFILPPEFSETPMEVYQRITGKFHERSFVFNSYVKSDSGSIYIEFFNDLGASAGSMSYDGENFDFYSPYLPPAARGEYMLADMQLVLYPWSRISEELESDGFRCEHEISGDTEIRRIYDCDTQIMVITRNGNSVSLVNKIRGYSYMIEEQR